MRLRLCVLVMLLAAMCLTAGCGNVYLKGEAATAVETSTMDAYGAVQRAMADEQTPGWTRAYLEENFRQWREFARAARKDTTWGPKLSGEGGE